MELGSLLLNKQVTDLGRMLNEVLAKVRPQIEEKQLDARSRRCRRSCRSRSSTRTRSRRVLVNLLGNAVKYTPAGGRVMFRVNVTDQELEISVEDTGVGIAEDELAKVFDKFFRSDDPRVQEQTGTGLGWRWRRKSCGCTAAGSTVESELNKGSTFTVLLPRG